MTRNVHLFPCLFTLWTSVRFLHPTSPFDFVENLFCSRFMDSQAWNRPCSAEHLSDISELISDWRAMAPFLGLSATDEADIFGRAPISVQAQRVDMLRTWKQNLGEANATYKKLADIFRKRSRQDLVEKVAKLVATAPDTSPGSGQ